MALVDDVSRLRVETLAALDESHDYFANTKSMWRLAQHQITQSNFKYIFHNEATGSAVTDKEIPGLAQEYITGYLASSTFQHFVSLLEDFIIALFRVWLTHHPQSLLGRELSFQTVLNSADKSEIIGCVVEKALVEISYGGMRDWFKRLDKIVKLDCPDQDQVDRLTEIKASRDILVHNNGIANALYVDKSKGHARFKDGERLEIPEPYHRESWELIKQVVTDLADAAIDKAR